MGTYYSDSSDEGRDDSNGFGCGFFTAVFLGLAIYGTYKAIQEITKSPSQKMLDNLGREIRQLESDE